MASRLKQIPESLLAKLWKERAARANSLRAANGRRIKVIYPGREGTTAGPDFRDALFEEEGVGLVRGDVEVHVTEGGWRAHRHHEDPRYNGVVLHVVGKADETHSRLNGGGQAPVLSLGPLFSQQPLGKEPGLWQLLEPHGYLQPVSRFEAANLLDQAGDSWFSEVSNGFSRLLHEEEPEQLLYSALMESLGYSQNRQPFLDLAHRVPYSRLLKAALKAPREERRQTIQEILLKAGGFQPAPSQASSSKSLGWHLFRVRPHNHPRRRIMGFAGVLDLFLPSETAVPMAGDQRNDGRLRPGTWAVSQPAEMDRPRQAATHTMARAEDGVPPWANVGLVTGMAQ